MNVFTKRLKEERAQLGVTQKQMAEKLNIPVDTYKNYESNGLRNCEPNIDTLWKIADVFNVTVDYLIGREK